MSSQATTDGLMTLTVTFKLGTDPDKAQQTGAEPRRPGRSATAGRSPATGHHDRQEHADLTLVVHLTSPNGRYDLTYLRNYALLNVKDRLARLEGVGDVQMCGSGDYSMRIWLDPQKVAARGLAAGDVVRAIREQNVQAAAGVVGASPGLPGVDLQLSINAQGRLQSEEAFGDIIVKTGDDGAITRLRDLARIELGASTYALRSTLDNEDAVGMPASSLRPVRMRSQISNSVPGADGRPEAVHAGRRGILDRLRHHQVRPGVDRIGDRDAARGDRARGAGRDPVPADLAGLDHSAAGRAGVGDRHLRRDAGARLLDQRADACSDWCWRSGSWSTMPSSWSRTSSATSKPACRRARPPTARCAKSPARSSRSRWCWSRCSSRWRSSAA